MRQARLKMRGVPAVYHCVTRVVAGARLLGEREREVLKGQIWRTAGFCGVEVLTYCLMANHFHLLVRVPPQEGLPEGELRRRIGLLYPEGDPRAEAFEARLRAEDPAVRERCRAELEARMGELSAFMKALKQRFSVWYNRAHGRFGALWAERFKSLLVEDDPFALRTVAAYIDLNPVRAGLARDPALYRHCGYAEAMGGARRAREGLVSLCGRGGWSAAARSYRVALFGKGGSYDAARGAGAAVDPERAREVLRSGGRLGLEEALRCRARYFTDGAALGSPAFARRVFEGFRERFGARRRDGPRPLRGADWGGLACLRGLRKDAFG